MYGRVTGKIGSGNVLKRRSIIAVLLVLGYSIYGLFFLSNSNAKSSEVRGEFTNLHPIVRLSISTVYIVGPMSATLTPANLSQTYIIQIYNGLHLFYKGQRIRTASISDTHTAFITWSVQISYPNTSAYRKGLLKKRKHNRI